MGVKILRKEKHRAGDCGNCHLDKNKDGASCIKQTNYNMTSPTMRCGIDYIFKPITPAEFNASTGKKWRVKKDGRVVSYEAS